MQALLVNTRYCAEDPATKRYAGNLFRMQP